MIGSAPAPLLIGSAAVLALAAADVRRPAYRNRAAAMTARHAARGTIAVLAAALACTSLASCGGGSDDSDAEIPAGPFVGVAPEGDQNATDYARMADGGVGVVRIVFQWSSIEASKGDLRLGRDRSGHGRHRLRRPRAAGHGVRDARHLREGSDRPADDQRGHPRRLERLPLGGRRALRRGRRFLERLRRGEPRRDAATDPRMGDLERAQLLELLDAEAGPGRLRRADRALVEGPRQGRSQGPGDERRHVRDPAVGRSDRLLRLHRSAATPRTGSTTPSTSSASTRTGPTSIRSPARSRTPARPSTRPGATPPMWVTEIGWGSDPDDQERSLQGSRAAGEPALGIVSLPLRLARRNRGRGGRLVHVARLRSMRRSGSAAGAPPPASSTPTATASRPGSPSPT